MNAANDCRPRPHHPGQLNDSRYPDVLHDLSPYDAIRPEAGSCWLKRIS